MRAILATAAVAAMVLAAASPAAAREIAYQGVGYSVYLDEPQYCSMFLDAPSGAMMRFSYRRTDGTVYFSYVHPGFAPLDASRGVAVFLDFDGVPSNRAYGGFPYALDDGRNGFGFGADGTMLERWARSRSVDIRLLEGDGRRLVERVDLRGSSNAVNSLMACTQPGFSPTVMPAPPEEVPPPPPGETGAYEEPSDETPQGRFRATCAGEVSTYHVGNRAIGRGVGCDPEWMPNLVHSRRFPSGEQVLLVIRGGGGMANEGSIIYVPPTGTPRVIALDYVTEFIGILAVDRVAYAASVAGEGMRDEWFACDVTIDWARGRIVSSRGRDRASRSRCN